MGDRYLRRRLEEERRLRQNAELRLKSVQRRHQPTTLFEYLDGCHTYLFREIPLQTLNHSPNGSLLYQGLLLPKRLRHWADFGTEQERIWQDLIETDCVLERRLRPLDFLEKVGERCRATKRYPQANLYDFHWEAVLSPLWCVVTELLSDAELRRHFHLLGSIAFENHKNTLTGELDNDPPLDTPPDKFCIYNEGSNQKIPACIVMLKEPFTLPLRTIKSTLYNMNIEDVLLWTPLEPDTPDTPGEIKDRRLMAAVIIQAFSSMIKSGVGYAYVFTGEAIIFLHVGRDPTKIFYYLSIPGEDVGETTGYVTPHSPNRLHLTAVGQVLAFTLQAMQKVPYCQRWQREAAARLKWWNMFPELVPRESTPEHQNRVAYAKGSPVMRRPKISPDPMNSSNKDPSNLTDPPSEAPHRSANVMVLIPSRPRVRLTPKQYCDSRDRSRPYCTHKCLLGLFKRGSLDKACPNVADHGTGRHQIDRLTFLALLQKQLSLSLDTKHSHGLYDSDGCESLHTHGSRGALFDVVLLKYGYKLVGKGFPYQFYHHLSWEKDVYERLRPIQGRHIPVCLGVADFFDRCLFYDGIDKISHVLLLSYAGVPLSRAIPDHKSAKDTATLALRAMHKLGVYHGDAFVRNMFWSTKEKSVMFISFDRARMWDTGRGQRRNRKRKRPVAEGAVNQGTLKIEELKMQADLELLYVRWTTVL